MDKEKERRGRVLKKNGTRFFSSSSSPSPSGLSINCNGRGDVYTMESCRKERAKGLKGSCSDNKEDFMIHGCNGGGSGGEEGNIFRTPLNTNGISSRKRIKLQGKAADDRGPDPPVEPPLVVPKAAKRLRSAIYKRTSLSASPPLSDSKRRTQLFNRSSGEKFQQKMLEEPSKDEEEVAATLISIASLITVSKPLETKEDGKILQENSETGATLASLLEGPKEECTKNLVPCNSTTVSDSIPSADLSILDQPTGASVSQKFDAEGNEAAQLKPTVALSSSVEPVEGVTPLTDPLGTSLQYFPQNGMLQPKPPSLATASTLQPALLSEVHEQLTMQPSNKDVVSSNSIVLNGLPNEKVIVPNGNRCRTHVRICHLIKTHKKAEKKQLFVPKETHLKAQEGNQMLPSARHLQAQQAAMLSGVYALQKQVYMPFTFSQGSCSQYQEWLAAGPSQQLMWQAHLAHYRPSSSPSSSLVNQPPSIFPPPVDFNPQNMHRTFLLPLTSPLSKQNLQKIANAESFR